MDPSLRSAAIEGTSFIGGICGTNKYSITEYKGFNSIQPAAHLLGHRLNLFLENLFILIF